MTVFIFIAVALYLVYLNLGWLLLRVSVKNQLKKLRDELIEEIQTLKHKTYSSNVSGLLTKEGVERFSKNIFARLRKTDTNSNRYTDARSVSVVAIDLDGLKKINDSEGHQSGDIAIGMVAPYLLSNVRASDIVAHLSGDEFVILMIDATDEVVHKRMKRAGEGLKQNLGVTLSCGVASALEHDREDMYEFLYNIADRRCNEVKIASGKRRV